MGERIQRIVIALGDRAMGGSTAPGSERVLASALARHLHPVLRAGVELVVTHRGVTPPVAIQGALRSVEDEEEGSEAVEDSLAASLREALDVRRVVTAVLTHVLVDPSSSGFRRPRRPVGPVLDEAAARELRSAGMPLTHEARSNGYRQLMPEIEPLELLDVHGLKRLLESGAVVVAGGGGGVPVIRDGGGWRSPEAVVDQDLTAALLADAIDADQLFIVTDVTNVFEAFGTPHEEPIGLISVDELHNLLAEGHFGVGTMAPKVEACVRFVSRPGRRAVICDASSLEQAMGGLAGTRVIWTSAVSRRSSAEQHVV